MKVFIVIAIIAGLTGISIVLFTINKVRVYDFKAKKISLVSKKDLKSNFVLATVEGISGNVWVDPNQLKPSEYKKLPFSGDIKKQIRKIQETLKEVDPSTYEQWEDDFRRDANPDQEISLWLKVVAIYSKYVTNGSNSMDDKKEIFQVLVGCMNKGEIDAMHGLQLKFLSREKADLIINEFFGD